jgi:hypothetical protein
MLTWLASPCELRMITCGAKVDLRAKEAEHRCRQRPEADMNEERSTVIVSIDSVEAYAEPQFVLEFGGKIYVTMAVMEYDPTLSDMDDDERSDLSELQAMLGGPRLVSGIVVGSPLEAASMAQAQSDDSL